MEMTEKKQYAAPKVIQHELIVFETALSSGMCPNGYHWEFQMSPSGFWQRVCVKD
ncbi:hypothetical protein [Paenibacillus hamazuiensis]|uniref:hypothetical protein n=1 Tax=Paenibacillus hamazuiensis TaxID=2936508 RepID=UPI00200ED55C|nr:hypothetical protein [Paenibacillus hamazuiensis]